MYRFQPLVVVILLITAVVAAPAQNLRRKRSFKIPRIQQHNYVPDGTFALRKAYRKFGIGKLDTFPSTRFAPKLAAANNEGNSTEDGEVSASPIQNDAQFLSPVSVGGQTLVMNFDSGSSDMSVPKEEAAIGDKLTPEQVGFQYGTASKKSARPHIVRPKQVHDRS